MFFNKKNHVKKSQAETLCANLLFNALLLIASLCTPFIFATICTGLLLFGPRKKGLAYKLHESFIKIKLFILHLYCLLAVHMGISVFAFGTQVFTGNGVNIISKKDNSKSSSCVQWNMMCSLSVIVTLSFI